MKKFFKQQLNFPYVVIVMLALTLGIAVAEGALPGESPSAISPLIHRGGGDQAINNLRIGCPNGACSMLGDAKLDTRGSQTNDVSVFDTDWNNSAYSSGTGAITFRVLQNAAFATRLFLGGTNTLPAGPGLNTAQIKWTQNYAGRTPAQYLQRVNIWGTAQSVPLKHNESTAQEVCIYRDGTLILCPGPRPVNGLCNASTENGGPYQNPPSSNLCTAGTASGVVTGSTTYTWTCFGLNGGTNDACTAQRFVPQITYNWEYSPWGSCVGGGGSCTGTPTENNFYTKQDWLGNAFNWERGRLYYKQGTTYKVGYICNMDFLQTGIGNQGLTTCMAVDPESSPNPTYHYVPKGESYNNWYYVTTGANPNIYATAVTNTYTSLYMTGEAYRHRCDIGSSTCPNDASGYPMCNGVCPADAPEGVWQPLNHACSPENVWSTMPYVATEWNDPNATSRNVTGSTLQNAYGYGCFDTGDVISCSQAQSQNSCTAISGCSWQANQGTQTRTATCKGSDGNVYNYQTCVDAIGAPGEPLQQSCTP